MVGGGGKDFLTLDILMDLLLQLTFVSEDENVLHFLFATSNHKVKKMIERILALSSVRNLPFEITICFTIYCKTSTEEDICRRDETCC
jgi:hypothetical protein